MGRIRLDRMLVFDLEETCWEGEPPPGERNEIIEIGVAEVLLDGEPRLGRTMGIDIHPVASQISAYCTALTGITPQRARRGRPLGEALASLHNSFGGTAKTWAAWGRDDRSLVRDCTALGLPAPALGGFLDLGATWAMLLGHSRPPGLVGALEAMGMQFEGRQHSAVDDACNTARIVVALSGVLRTAATLQSSDACTAEQQAVRLAR